MTPHPRRRRVALGSIAASLLLVGAAVPGAAQDDADLGPDAWRGDLTHLERVFAERHLNAFHRMSPSAFETGLQRVRERVGAWPDHFVVVQLARVVNQVGDGHSGLRIFSDTALAFRSYPLQLRVFPDGIHVVAAAGTHADLVGGRVTRIGNRSAAAALAEVAEVVARDNGMDALTFGPTLLVVPEVLHGLGIIESMERAAFTVDVDGQARTVLLAPRPGPFRLEGHSLLDRRSEAEGWVRLLNRDGSGPTPRLHRDPTAPFWMEWLPGERSLYVQINHVTDGSEESFADFSHRVLRAAGDRDARRIVLDLRWCRGGNGYLIRPLVLGLLGSDLDAEGRLWVLIGRRTFSAGQMLVSELERLSQARFVGEPTANRPNSYGDNEKIVLPGSHLTVRAAYVKWQLRDPRDMRDCTAPHLLAPWTVDDWRRGRDPALAIALADAQERGAATRRPADGEGIYSVFLCRNGGPRTESMF